MIRVVSPGSFKRTVTFLNHLRDGDMYNGIDALAKRGTDALAKATPRRTGETAASWTHGIERRRGGLTIFWTNTHENSGQQIALLIQLGHGTGTGGYVSGIDYINPAIRPVFDEIAREVWEKVTNG